MRRTITRTHPNRSRGKSTSTSAATQSTTTHLWTRSVHHSRWSSRGIIEPVPDLMMFCVSGRDGPDSGETLKQDVHTDRSVRTANLIRISDRKWSGSTAGWTLVSYEGPITSSAAKLAVISFSVWCQKPYIFNVNQSWLRCIFEIFVSFKHSGG